SYEFPPAEENAEDHPHPYLEAAPVIDVPAFAGSHPLVESNRAFNEDVAVLQGAVQEMGIEFQVHPWIDVRKQRQQSLSPAQFISRADIGDRASSKVLGLQQL